MHTHIHEHTVTHTQVKRHRTIAVSQVCVFVCVSVTQGELLEHNLSVCVCVCVSHRKNFLNKLRVWQS
jgi:hypothetical protein